MPSITEREFKASYALGIQVYNKKISIEDAVAILVDDYQMNEASANMYINFFLHMMRGKVYKRLINQAGLRYYCKNVLRDYGVEQLKIFLKGLELHIKYRQSIESTAHAFRVIHNEYSEKAGVPPIFN